MKTQAHPTVMTTAHLMLAVTALALVSPPPACLADEHYVNAASGGGDPPFTNWMGAALTIQDALDAASHGDTVWVTNGLYATGFHRTPGGVLLSRVVVTNDVTVRSCNGPGVTVIVGASDAVTEGNGANAVRGVYMTGGALSGFTVSNGFTRADGDGGLDRSGGGACLRGGLMSNCWVMNCGAEVQGGGIFGGTAIACRVVGNAAMCGGGTAGVKLDDCVVGTNRASVGGGCYMGSAVSSAVIGNMAEFGAGTWGSWVSNCTIEANEASHEGGGVNGGSVSDSTLRNNSAGVSGGGVDGGRLSRCRIVGNDSSYGGGTSAGILENCLVWNNTALASGGGAHGGVLLNCTVVSNRATTLGGGVYRGALTNCIVSGNLAADGSNTWQSSGTSCCSRPPPSGTGHVTNAPGFVNEEAEDFRLAAGSACIDTGVETGLEEDLNGVPRPQDGNDDGTNTIDIGAYEFLPVVNAVGRPAFGLVVR